MTSKLTPAQTRDLLAAATAGGTHSTTHGPRSALVARGLATEAEATDGYGFTLTPAGWDAASSLGYEGSAPEAPAPAPQVERFDACPRCGFAFKTPQPECRVRAACDKRAAARVAA